MSTTHTPPNTPKKRNSPVTNEVDEVAVAASAHTNSPVPEPRALELCPEEPIVSPKKKSKIVLKMLKTKKISTGPSRIGEVLKMVQVRNGMVVKAEVKDVRILCSVTENRTGRVPGDAQSRAGRRFIYVADCTAFMSIGMVASESGISKYDVDESLCQEDTRCFFNAVLRGDIAWIPTRGKLDSPTFFLNNGRVERENNVSWGDERRLMFPTTDVCRQMVKSKYGKNGRFTTTGICGKVDLCSEHSDGDVVISLEDPVGYAAVEINCSVNGGSAESFIMNKGLTEGIFVFFKGKISIENFSGQDNAVLKMSSDTIEIEILNKHFFEEYRIALGDMNLEWFAGNIPEYM